MRRFHQQVGIEARLLLLVGLLLLPGCLTESQWTFCFSRSAYAGGISANTSHWNYQGGESSGAAVVLLFAPLVIDIVILPVTVPRDLWVLATDA